jgi:hypothetical protein
MKDTLEAKRPSVKLPEHNGLNPLDEQPIAKPTSLKRTSKKPRRTSRAKLDRLDSILGLATLIREVEWKPGSPPKLTRAATHVAIAQFISRQMRRLQSPSTMSSVS